MSVSRSPADNAPASQWIMCSDTCHPRERLRAPGFCFLSLAWSCLRWPLGEEPNLSSSLSHSSSVFLSIPSLSFKYINRSRKKKVFAFDSRNADFSQLQMAIQFPSASSYEVGILWICVVDLGFYCRKWLQKSALSFWGTSELWLYLPTLLHCHCSGKSLTFSKIRNSICLLA